MGHHDCGWSTIPTAVDKRVASDSKNGATDDNKLECRPSNSGMDAHMCDREVYTEKKNNSGLTHEPYLKLEPPDGRIKDDGVERADSRNVPRAMAIMNNPIGPSRAFLRPLERGLTAQMNGLAPYLLSTID